jgi:hypothetical protein
MRCPVCGGLEFYMTNPPKCVVCTVWRRKLDELPRFEVWSEYSMGVMNQNPDGDYLRYADVIAMMEGK